ncbi:MAG: glycosyltransferase involved in cell wall biosynthesis [Oleiphilaceae bacterium]|jgi:glycosyltransferase involved in cell wall biosynthesis
MTNLSILKHKYVFMYPDIAEPTVKEISEAQVPRERLVGFYQLLERGWDVKISDARWKGPFANLRRKLKRYITLPSIGMFRDWLPADVIVIKDDFSLYLSFVAKLMGKKLVYLDSMFTIPKSPIRNFLIKVNLILADRVICFSSSQADLWSDKYKVKRGKFSCLHYGIDSDFYKKALVNPSAKSKNVLAIGRDTGRDFGVLAEAVRDTEAFLYLVTLPYLLPNFIKDIPNVQVKERLSYQELIELYQESSISVVPLKGALTYPSGIRAVMEAMALGKPVIATYTPVLAEYFVDDEDIMLVKSGSLSDMSLAIKILLGDESLRCKLVERSYDRLVEEFSVEKYVNNLEKILVDISKIS